MSEKSLCASADRYIPWSSVRDIGCGNTPNPTAGALLGAPALAEVAAVAAVVAAAVAAAVAEAVAAAVLLGAAGGGAGLPIIRRFLAATYWHGAPMRAHRRHGPTPSSAGSQKCLTFLHPTQMTRECLAAAFRSASAAPLLGLPDMEVPMQRGPSFRSPWVMMRIAVLEDRTVQVCRKIF
jgi:hypothetical protein